MPSFFDSRARQALHGRLSGLAPDTSGRWGRMTAHQAVCHLADSFAATLGDRPLTPVDAPWYMRSALVRFVALTVPLPWPKGVPTAREMDQEREGTPPGEFELDLARLGGLMDRFAASQGRGLRDHVLFGALSPGEWGRWAWRHTDHHLRQFGV